MSNNVNDLRDTIVPKSDQLNAEQLLGGPITITVTDVRRGGGDEQPVIVHYEGEGGRPYKPCKTMRKVLVFAWGPDGRAWAGKSMTLYNRPDVKFGGEAVGGIRISHLSHIDRSISIALTSTRGRKEQTRIERLDEAETVAGSRARLEAAARGGMKNLQAAWGAIPAEHRAMIGPTGCPNELKQIAKGVDSNAPSNSAHVQELDAATSAGIATDAQAAEVIDWEATAQSLHDSLTAAEDRDALDDKASLINTLPEDRRAPLYALYDRRCAELEQKDA